jgi:hypothetical protein
MSRKDFNLIAETIRFLPLDSDMRARVANAFADSLRGTNARFDRNRFIAASMPTNR